jgi:abortive infection bacteriophage resistance protein
MDKTFKSIDEQIQILKSKGLIIKDEAYAKEVLLRENYFFLTGYRHVFYKEAGSRGYNPNTTFEELYSLFYFDRQFRNVIFKNLLIIENNYKSFFSYTMSKNYGYKEKDYLNMKNFDARREKIRQIGDLLRKLKRQIRVNGGQHQATMHYMQNYGYVPMWVGVKVLSFGLISEMYSILKQKDKDEIADMYHLDSNTLEMFLPILANYRNICAHEDILFSHQTQKIIPDNKYHKLLNISRDDEGEYINGKNDLFALIIILKHMLSKDDFKMMMNEIIYEFEYLDARVDSIHMDKVSKLMGFPKNYKDIMYIE